MNSKRTPKIVKQFKNQLFEVALKETNVLSVDLTKTEYDKEEVEHITENIRYIARDHKYLLLINSDPESSITYEGLKVLARPGSLSYAIAKAYVITSLPQKLMANFYLHFFKPSIPVKFFKNKREAELWLLKTFRHVFAPVMPDSGQVAFA